MNPSRILVVDDEPIARENLEHVLSKEGYEVVVAENGVKALKEIESQPFDVVLTDLKMKRVDGIGVLEKAKELDPKIEVVLITAYATVSSAIEAMRKGAYHYIPKPFKLDEVRMVIKKALEKKSLADELDELKREYKSRVTAPFIVGKSREMQNLVDTIKMAGPTDCNVLIFGETGTGKELVARAIHYHSNRSEEKFLAFNCGSFTEDLLANELFGHEKEAYTGASTTRPGLLETAKHGTIFLDEVGEMPTSMQVKLLRAIEEKKIIRVGGTREIPVDVRIVAATNRDLKQAIDEGHFRQDLFYRLNVMSITVPPLVERKDDIPLLIAYFLKRYSSEYEKTVEGVSEEAMGLLTDYQYPGNVRELENIMERAVALAKGPVIQNADLPEDLRTYSFSIQRQRTGKLPSLEENEKEYIRWVLKHTRGNKTEAAKILEIDRVSLWRKIKRLNIEE